MDADKLKKALQSLNQVLSVAQSYYGHSADNTGRLIADARLACETLIQSIDDVKAQDNLASKLEVLSAHLIKLNKDYKGLSTAVSTARQALGAVIAVRKAAGAIKAIPGAGSLMKGLSSRFKL